MLLTPLPLKKMSEFPSDTIKVYYKDSLFRRNNDIYNKCLIFNIQQIII